MAIGKSTASSALDVNGTVNASIFAATTKLVITSVVYPYIDLVRASTSDVFPDWRIENSSGLNFQQSVSGSAFTNIMSISDSSVVSITGALTVSGTITGTLATSSQPNITATGNLTIPASLTITNGTTPLSITNTTSSSTFNLTIQNSGGAQDIGSTTAHQLALKTNGTRRLTITSGGNITIADTVSGLQLDLGSTGTGLNVPNLTFRGTSFNDTYYTGITTGGAVASKAVVLNSTLDYSGIHDLSCTGTFIASTAAKSPSITCNTITGDNGAGSSILNLVYSTLNINGVSMVSTAAELNYVDVSQGVSTASKALVMNSSNKIGSIGELGFSAVSANYKTVMRTSTISGSTGIEFYDTQLVNPKAVVNFRSDNNSEPVFLEMRGYLNDGSIAANGWPAQLRWIGGQGLLAGINLTVSNTSNTGAGVANNVVLSTRNGTIPHVVCNDQKNQLHLWPQGLAELNTSYAQNVIIGEELLIRKSLQIGTSQDTARLISALDSTMVGGDARYITFGRDNSSKNQAEISFYYDSGASNANRIDFGFYGGALMYLLASGRLGVGTSSPRAPLEVAGTTGSIQIISISTNTYGYNVSSNSWTNYGGGPITIPSLSAVFNGNIYVSQNVFTTSDRRLKDNINEIHLDLERYKKLRPVSYTYKNDTHTKIGLIAQEVLGVCAEAVSMTENPNLQSDGEDSPEGIQLGMDYSVITILNVNIIKKLIDRIEVLEDTVNRLIARPVVAKWMNKQ